MSSSHGFPTGIGGIPRQFPHLKDLQNEVSHELSQVTEYSSIESLFEKCHSCNQRVLTDIDFKRPDRAYVEWLKSEEILKLITRHRDFPYLPQQKKDKYMSCRKVHEGQRPMLSELQDIIEQNNSKNGTRSIQDTSARGSNSVSSQPLSNRPISMPRAPGIQSASAPRPISQPPNPRPPSNLNQSSGQNYNPRNGEDMGNPDPLLARFSQLRTSATAVNRPPYPIGEDALRIPSSPGPNNHTNPPLPHLSHTQSAPESREQRPSGPRDMPSTSQGPIPPPKRPLQPTVTTALPRAPDPVYSPARNIAAPASIAPPRSSARSTAPVPTKSNTSINGYQLPPQNYTARNNNTSSMNVPQKPRLPVSNTISVEDVHKYSRSHSILLIDARSRESFDEGHIGFSSIVCIEPFDIRLGTSYEDFLDSLAYTPQSELKCLENIRNYDLVVIYTEDCFSDDFLRGPSERSSEPQLRMLYDTLTRYNYNNPLQRPPAILVGGLNGWTDTFGPQSLKTSETNGIPASKRLPKPLQRPAARRVSAADGSSREIRRRRLEEFQPLNRDEEREWKEQARREQLAPAEFRRGTDSDEDEGPQVLHNYDDFFRRFPPVGQESMVVPRLPPPNRSPAPIPSAPSRPAPAVSRPSYSGVSDRLSSQRTESAQPPLYTSRFISQHLKLPKTGLINFHNTCYMNATIQCLLGTLAMSRFFLDDTWRTFVQRNNKKSGGSEGIMPEIYAALIRGLWRDDGTAIRPISMRKFCMRLDDRWNNDNQQDAQEFIGWLIDMLHMDLNANHTHPPFRALTEQEEALREKMPMAHVSKIEWDRYSKREYSFISTLFAGQMASRITCLHCNSTSTTYETTYMFPLEIPALRKNLTIYDLLHHFFKEELLEGDNAWRCSACKTLRRAKKQIKITRVPQVLAIMFKRNEFTADSQAKIQRAIDFPLHCLDLEPFMWDTFRATRDGEGVDHAVTKPMQYEAYAVMRHIGNTVRGGHYTAVVRDAARAEWRMYNDDHVTMYDPHHTNDRLQNEKAYMVFYERSRAR